MTEPVYVDHRALERLSAFFYHLEAMKTFMREAGIPTSFLAKSTLGAGGAQNE